MRKPTIRRNAACAGERGQMMPLIALFAVALIVMVGLVIDLGFAYITRAQLSKAVDAAVLAGMNNINLGTTTAGNVASATFAANYTLGKSPRVINTPTVSYYFGTDTGGNPTFSMAAKTQVNTYFVRVLGVLPGMPKWTTLTVGETAQVTRATLYVDLVLDRSSSIWGNGCPGTNPEDVHTMMYPSLTNFLSFFDETFNGAPLDHGGLVTFGTTGGVRVVISEPFITSVGNGGSATYAGASPNPAQYTFCEAGLSNSLVQLTNSVPPTGRFVVKAVVFFTDGDGATDANALRTPLSCGGRTTDVEIATVCGGIAYLNPTNGAALNPACSNPGTPGSGGNGKFNAAYANGGAVNITVDNVTTDARFRSIVMADKLRANKIAVYSIGLAATGNAIEFDKEIANDPTQNHSMRGSYSATPYDGMFVLAPNGTDLAPAFQRIAEALLLQVVR
jgi:Flp pilus assembly protein TadG